MDKKEEIRKKLKGMATANGSTTMLAKVKSVDDAEFTCVLEDDDNAELTYEDVRLRPVLDGAESFTLFPKVGTWVLAIRIEEDNDWMIIAAGEVDKVRMKCGTSELEIKNGFLIKKGSETMKKIMDDLFTAIQALTVNTNVGPSSVPINSGTFAAIKVRADNLLK
jgi:hypothetical protein